MTEGFYDKRLKEIIAAKSKELEGGKTTLTDITTDNMVSEALARYNNNPTDKNFEFLMKLWEKKQNVIDESNADTVIDLGELIEITRSKFESTPSSDEHDSTDIQEK